MAVKAEKEGSSEVRINSSLFIGLSEASSAKQGSRFRASVHITLPIASERHSARLPAATCAEDVNDYR